MISFNRVSKSYGKDSKALRDVSFDVEAGEMLFLTGHSGAGKTTILKATIINVLLSQQLGYGFYKKGIITPFDVIHCYLNIPDTNSRDSLFQAEARRCFNILESIRKDKIKKQISFIQRKN